jgi:methyl-accepting chemotaxis protein
MEKGSIGMAVVPRRTYLIKRAFQFRYALIISLFILLTVGISSIITYLAVFPYLSRMLANVYPQGRLITILRIANIKTLFSAIVIIPFAAWFSIMISHRIAGPWYRMEAILRKIAEGGLISEVSLRKGDELQSLAGSLNMVIRNLRETAQENIGYTKAMDGLLNSIEQELQKQPVDAMKINLLISKTHEISNDLKKSIKRYNL